MGRIQEGHATRQRMADALLGLLAEKDPRQVKIREITDRANMSRQTFYHHFDDIYDLAGYAYDREIARLFGCEDIEETYALFDANYCSRIVEGLESQPAGLRALAVFMHEQNPRGHFYEVVKRNISVDLKPMLEERGIRGERLGLVLDIFASSQTAIIMSWLAGNMVVSGKLLAHILRKEEEAVMESFQLDMHSL